jgi:hypothetical protein
MKLTGLCSWKGNYHGIAQGQEKRKPLRNLKEFQCEEPRKERREVRGSDMCKVENPDGQGGHKMDLPQSQADHHSFAHITDPLVD